MPQESVTTSCRLDKWLWAARFFKTRALAKEAITGGKIHCNGVRCKPSKLVQLQETLVIRINQDQKTIIVNALAETRGNASFAQTLYEETKESIQQREHNALTRKQGFLGTPTPNKPTKKQRRQLNHLQHTYHSL